MCRVNEREKWRERGGGQVLKYAHRTHPTNYIRMEFGLGNNMPFRTFVLLFSTVFLSQKEIVDKPTNRKYAQSVLVNREYTNKLQTKYRVER